MGKVKTDPAKPLYLISRIYYDANRPDFPWWTTRVGAVAEQGGLAFGSEETGHRSLADALKHLKHFLIKDEALIQTVLKENFSTDLLPESVPNPKTTSEGAGEIG